MQRAIALLEHQNTFGQLQRHAEIVRAVVVEVAREGDPGAALFLGCHDVRLVLRSHAWIGTMIKSDRRCSQKQQVKRMAVLMGQRGGKRSGHIAAFYPRADFRVAL